MRITKRQLKRIIREEYSKIKRQSRLNEAKSFPWYEPKQPEHPYTHGHGGYGGDHSTLFGNIRDHEKDDPGVIDMIIDWAHEVDAMYKDAYGAEEDRLYTEDGFGFNDSGHKKAMQNWLDVHRKEWMSKYSDFGASEVIPERVWGMLFDYIIGDFMSPKEFLNNIYSARR